MQIKEKRSFIITIVVTLIALSMIVTYNFISFYTNTVNNVEAIGVNSLAAEVNQLKAYLAQGTNTLRVASDNVDYMLEQKRTLKEIEGFLEFETDKFQQEIDENFTGVYGYLNGEYVDGSNWTPPSDYVPTERDWYKAAYSANGEPVIVPPYVDAETNEVIVSVCRLLSDGKSVISLDIVLNHVQEITKEMNLNNMGYAFIVDENGMVIAHHDDTQIGKNYKKDEEMSQLLRNSEHNNSFNMDISGERSYVFTDMATDNWRVFMVISTSKLLEPSRQLLIKNIIIAVVVYALIIFFTSSSLKKIVRSVREINEKQREVENANKDLEHSKDVINYIAFTNILTKMKNRHGLYEDMNEKIKTENFTAAYFDIDNFRRVNETYGYEFGDKLLINIANKLQKELGENTEIYNIFGNEFCLIFKDNIQGAKAMNIANTAFNIISNTYNIDKKDIRVYASGAMYYNTPAVCDTVDKMLLKLEDIVREIKHSGGNNCRFM